MLQRAALLAGEDCFVNGLGQVSLAEDNAPTGSPQCLMGCRRHNLAEGDWAGVQTGRDEARDVGHVHQQFSAYAVRDLPQTGEVNDARVSAATGHN